MADAETVDPAVEIRERCGNSVECRGLKQKLEACEKRVAGGSHENCEEELYDFLHCVDKLAAPELFTKLK